MCLSHTSDRQYLARFRATRSLRAYRARVSSRIILYMRVYLLLCVNICYELSNNMRVHNSINIDIVFKEREASRTTVLSCSGCAVYGGSFAWKSFNTFIYIRNKFSYSSLNVWLEFAWMCGRHADVGGRSQMQLEGK